MTKEKKNVWIYSSTAAVAALLLYGVMKIQADKARKESERILKEFKTIEDNLQKRNDSIMAHDTIIKFKAE